jgi:hypothetical protein
MSKRTMLALALAIASPAAVSSVAVSASQPSVHVRPTTVHAGDSVRVFGNAGGCRRGNQVTLISRAFSRRHEFAGRPAIFATVHRRGRFSVRTRIPKRRAPHRYGVTGRCGGGNLGVTAHLRERAPR